MTLSLPDPHGKPISLGLVNHFFKTVTLDSAWQCSQVAQLVDLINESRPLSDFCYSTQLLLFMWSYLLLLVHLAFQELVHLMLPLMEWPHNLQEHSLG